MRHLVRLPTHPDDDVPGPGFVRRRNLQRLLPAPECSTNQHGPKEPPEMGIHAAREPCHAVLIRHQGLPQLDVVPILKRQREARRGQANQVAQQRLGRALDTRPTIEVDAGQLCQVLLIKELKLPAMWQ